MTVCGNVQASNNQAGRTGDAAANAGNGSLPNEEEIQALEGFTAAGVPLDVALRLLRQYGGDASSAMEAYLEVICN